MRFKRFKAMTSVLFVAVMLAAGVGCSKFLNGKEKEAEVIELSDSRFEGLRELPGTLKKFATGEGDAAEIERSLKTLEEALIYFKERTKGSVENAYSVEDLRKFFGKYYLKENNVSPELARSLMRLKKALYGGSELYLSKTEIERIVRVLGLVRSEAGRMIPHMKVLLLKKETGEVSESELHEAIQQLQSTAQALLEVLDLSRSDYTFLDTVQVLRGLAEFIQGEGREAFSRRLNTWLPLVSGVRTVLYGEQAILSGMQDWSDALTTAVDLYHVLLKYNYFLKSSKFSSPGEIRSAFGFAEQVLQLVENSHRLRKSQRILFTDIDRALKSVEVSGVLALPVSVQAISDTYKKVLNPMLDPVRRGQPGDSLERDHLLALRRELRAFRLHQSFIESLPWASKASLSMNEVRAALKVFARDSEIATLSQDGAERKKLAEGFEQFRHLLNKPRPIAFDAGGRVLIVANPEALVQTRASLIRFSVMQSLTRLMMAGYGDMADPVQGGVTPAKFDQWYADFDTLGREVKAFDPRGKNSGRRSYQESTFFTFSGDGGRGSEGVEGTKDKAQADEMFEFVSFLFSGGMVNVEQLRKGLVEAGCAVEKRDVFKFPMLKEACVKDRLRAEFGKYFPNLPGLERFIREMSTASWERFYADWISTARTSDPNGGLIETADLRTGGMIFHYSESLFTQFDTDRNDRLSVDETKSAAPRFVPFLETVAGSYGETVLSEAFVVLLFTGENPAKDFWGTSFPFLIRRLFNNIGISEVDRSQILLVFKNLKNASQSP